MFESNVKSVFQKKTIIINDEVNRYYELKDGIRNIIIVDYQSWCKNRMDVKMVDVNIAWM